MKRILLVDDLRNFRAPDESADTFIARTSRQGLDILEREVKPWDEIWLDHDLGEVEGQLDDIMRVVDYLCERAFNDEPVAVNVVYVHTSNAPGAGNMLRSLARFGYNAQRVAPEPYFIVESSEGSAIEG